MCAESTGVQNSQGEIPCSDKETRGFFFPLRHQDTGTTRTAETRMEIAPQNEASSLVVFSTTPSSASPLTGLTQFLCVTCPASQQNQHLGTHNFSFSWMLGMLHCGSEHWKTRVGHCRCSTAPWIYFPHSGPRCPNYGLQVLVCWCSTFQAGKV